MVNSASQSPHIRGIGILSRRNTGLGPVLLAPGFEPSGPLMAHSCSKQVEGTAESRLNILMNGKLKSRKIDHEYVWNKLARLYLWLGGKKRICFAVLHILPGLHD